jgi:hypothetical protein
MRWLGHTRDRTGGARGSLEAGDGVARLTESFVFGAGSDGAG